MSTVSLREAIARAMHEEMARDESVIFFGEDVAQAGGVFKATPGLLEEFGPERVRDTPISENAIIGAGVGAAITGMRPVVELMFADFAAVALDQIINQAAKMRYMSNGQLKVPLTIRAAQGGGGGYAAQHSQCVEALFMNSPGIKIAVPGNPADALGLLKTAIRDDNPVMFLEHKLQYAEKGDVPEDEHLVPFGEARIVREGSDVTVIATQRMVAVASKAADELQRDDISCEVIDPRTLVPLDFDTISASIEKTGRLVTVEESVYAGGWGSHVVSLAADASIWSLDAPVQRVTLDDGIIPFSEKLESALMPSSERVAQAIRNLA